MVEGRLNTTERMQPMLMAAAANTLSFFMGAFIISTYSFPDVRSVNIRFLFIPAHKRAFIFPAIMTVIIISTQARKLNLASFLNFCA